MRFLQPLTALMAAVIPLAAPALCIRAAAPVTGPVEVIHGTRKAYEQMEKQLLKYTAAGTYHDDDIEAKVTIVRDGRAAKCTFETYTEESQAQNANRLPRHGRAFTELITGRGTIESLVPSFGQLKIVPCPDCGFSAPVKTTPDRDLVEFRPGTRWSRLLDLENPQGTVDNWVVTTKGNTSIITRASGEYRLCLEVDHSLGGLGVKAWEENSPIGGHCKCVYSWSRIGESYLPAKLERTIVFPADAKVPPIKRVLSLANFKLDATPIESSFASSRPDGWIIYRSDGKVQVVGGEQNRVRSMFRLVGEAQLILPKEATP